jgi:hypothetical protein
MRAMMGGAVIPVWLIVLCMGPLRGLKAVTTAVRAEYFNPSGQPRSAAVPGPIKVKIWILILAMIPAERLRLPCHEWTDDRCTDDP